MHVRPLICVLVASLLSLASSIACSSSSSSATTGDAGGPATPAAGGGVCCPVTATAGCSSVGYFGGWKASASDCKEDGLYDGYGTSEGTDSHGCRVIGANGGGPLCGAPSGIYGPDAQSDGGSDAQISPDAPPDAADAADGG